MLQCMRYEEAVRWAEDWIESWNAHDLERVLDHFSPDAIFSSPFVAIATGQENALRGREQLERYWREGLRLLPALHFDLEEVLVGVGTLAISYRNERGRSALEVLEIGADRLASRGWALYGPEASQP